MSNTTYYLHRLPHKYTTVAKLAAAISPNSPRNSTLGKIIGIDTDKNARKIATHPRHSLGSLCREIKGRINISNPVSHTRIASAAIAFARPSMSVNKEVSKSFLTSNHNEKIQKLPHVMGQGKSQLYASCMRWCVCTPTCVRTYHGTRRARHRRNKRKLSPNTLVRRELPQNHNE